MSNEIRTRHIETQFLKYLTINPSADLFTSEDVLGPNPPRGDKHLLSHVLKDRGYCKYNSPRGWVWSNQPNPKWINPRRNEIEKTLNEYLSTESPEEIVTQSFLERFYPNDLSTRRPDKHLLARILSDRGWIRKIEAMPAIKKTKSQMARVWVRPKERRRKPLLSSKDA